MKSFQNYVAEATFNASSIDKVGDLLQPLLQKKLGYKLYRYGGPDGFQDIVVGGSAGKGLLFFDQKRRAFRINFIGGKTESVSIWKEFKTDKFADFTVNLGGVNIVNIIDTIVDIIKKPKVGNLDMYFMPESVESEGEMITEARRAKPEEFYAFAKQMFPNVEEDKFDYNMLNMIGQANGVQIPGYVRAQKVDKTHFNISPPAPESAAAKKSPEPVWHIAITGKDPVSGKFFSAKDNSEAGAIMTQLKASLSPSALPSKEEVKDPTSLFGKLVKLTNLVIKGVGNSLFVYGGPGIGKTFTVTDTIKEAGLVKNQDWYHIKGKVTATSLYQTLFIHRQGKLIVFDDADSAFGSEDAANILKGALDSYDERFISWNSARTVNVGKMTTDEREEFYNDLDEKILDDPSNPKIKYPSEFKYEGRVIFISNLSANEIDTAILSRSFKIDMTLTDAQIFYRLESLIDHIGGDSVSKDIKVQVLNHLKEKNALGDLKNPNIRMFVVALKIAASGDPDWFDLLENT